MHWRFTSFFVVLSVIYLYDANQTETIETFNLNPSVANVIADKVKVLCWILTAREYHKVKAVHVKNTWGKRCNTLLFLSTVQDPDLPSVALLMRGGGSQRWSNIKDAFRYIYQYHFADADWFLKADDDTYVIVENLKYMLYGLNSSQPLYLGNQMKKAKPMMKSRNKQSTGEHIYMSGGSGYVLSKEALRRFVEVAFFNPTICEREINGQFADIEMGFCMKALKIPPIDTRDDKGKERFMGIHPQYLLAPNVNPDYKWYFQDSAHTISRGMNCCSVNPILFHQIRPMEMYLLEFLLYYIRPFGVNYMSGILPRFTNTSNLSFD